MGSPPDVPFFFTPFPKQSPEKSASSVNVVYNKISKLNFLGIRIKFVLCSTVCFPEGTFHKSLFKSQTRN